MRPWGEIVAELMAAHLTRQGPRWHLVQVAPQSRDQNAIRRLERHYEAYYPLERSWRPVPRLKLSRRQREAGVIKLQETIQPMFPRYVFTRFDPAGPWHDIFRLSGITGVVLRNGLPVPISDALITALRDREVSGAIPGTTPAIEVFRIGQWVNVADGPFATLRGQIHQIRTSNLDGIDAPTKLIVLIELFGRLTPCDVDVAAINPVPEAGSRDACISQ